MGSRGRCGREDARTDPQSVSQDGCVPPAFHPHAHCLCLGLLQQPLAGPAPSRQRWPSLQATSPLPSRTPVAPHCLRIKSKLLLMVFNDLPDLVSPLLRPNPTLRSNLTEGPAVIRTVQASTHLQAKAQVKRTSPTAPVPGQLRPTLKI